VVELAGGDILCYMRHGSPGGHVWRSRSKDEGHTWSPPELTNLRNPCSPIALAVSADSGRLIIAYNDSYRLRTPLCVGVSNDYGRTWHVRDIESGPGEYSYPQLIQTPDGQWHVFYCRNLQFIQHGWFDEQWLEHGRQVIGLRS
jgi:predicted neuraminidase